MLASKQAQTAVGGTELDYVSKVDWNEEANVTAYVIYHQTEIFDPDAYRQDYLGAARASVAKFGGRPLIGGEFEVLEGEWPGLRVVVHEFPDMETLNRWYDSEDFKPLKELRQRVSKGNLIVAEGF